jgi:hypothetical protein
MALPRFLLYFDAFFSLNFTPMLVPQPLVFRYILFDMLLFSERRVFLNVLPSSHADPCPVRLEHTGELGYFLATSLCHY